MAFLFTRVLFALAGICSLSLLAICVPAIFTHRDLSHPESIVPWAVREVAHGNPLYSDWRQWPHRLMPYGPLLTWPVGKIFGLLGVQEYGFSFYLAGRLQAFFYMLGTAAVAAAMLSARRFWLAILITLASIGLWPGLAIPGVSFRGDWPALFWSLMAALVAFRSPANTRTIGLTLGCFLLSVAYRPALWSFPAAYALYLLSEGQVRKTAAWSAATVIGVLSYLVAGYLITDGLFVLNQVGASSMGLTTEVYRMLFQFLMTPQEFPLITWDLFVRLFLGVPAAVCLIRKPRTPFEKGISIYFLLSLVVNLMTMFKAGASFNYIIEAYILSTVVVAIWGFRIWTRPDTRPHLVKASLLTSVTLLFLLPCLFFSYINFKTAPRIWAERHVSDHQMRLLELPSTALLGDLAFTHPSPSAHSISDPLPYARLARKGEIPREPLVSRVSSQEFSHIVLSPGMEFLFFNAAEAPWAGETIEDYYRLDFESEHYKIWVPRDASDTGESALLPSPDRSE